MSQYMLFSRRDCQAGVASAAVMLMVLVVTATLLGGIWVSKGMLAANRWPVRYVQVEGEFKRVSVEQLRGAIAHQMHKGFFAVDLDGVKAAAEVLPWVDVASARKRWPDTVQLRVLEHEPAARWQGTALIDQHGTRFDVDQNDQIQGLPELDGPDGWANSTFVQYNRFRELLLVTGLDVHRLKVTARGAWTLWLSDGIVLELGRAQLEQRLTRFARSYEQLSQDDNGGLARADLRYTNGMALTWRNSVSFAEEARYE